MRHLILSLFGLITLLSASAQQVPQALNYQAVARTTSGVLIPTQNVSVRFSVLDGSTNGNVLYQETHSTATNSYGLFTLPIGRGTATIGTFASIPWGSTDKFLRVEISPDGSTNYTVQGTTQLLSVPYALFAGKTNLVAGNAISVTNGNTISATYTGGTGINVTGSTISHALQAGSGINITGATVSTNLVAGPGIAINGNTISSTGSGSTLWVADAFGQRNISGNVGIGTASQSTIPLTLFTPNSGVGNAGLHIKSNDVWHTGMSMFNETSAVNYSLLVGGALNSDVKPGNFAIFNHQANAYILQATSANFVGIGSSNPSTPPRAKLHVFNGDIDVEQVGSGIIMKSPNGQCWRVTVTDSGAFQSTAIACP